MEQFGYQALLHVIRSFGADVVVVIGNDALAQSLQADTGKQPQQQPEEKEQPQDQEKKCAPEIIQVPRSSGVVVRSREARAASRNQRMQEYFYGVDNALHPHVVVVPFSALRVYQVNAAPSGRPEDLTLTDVIPATLAVGTVLALMSCTDPAQCLTASVAGYLVVRTKPDVARKTLTLLSPCPGALPSSVCLVGTVSWLG